MRVFVGYLFADSTSIYARALPLLMFPFDDESLPEELSFLKLVNQKNIKQKIF